MRQRGNYSVIHLLCMSGIGKSTLGQRAISEMHKCENLNSDLRSVLSGTNFITSDCNSGGGAFITDDALN